MTASSDEARARLRRLLEARARPAAPLTHAQEELWRGWQADPRGDGYHVSRAWRLEGALDPQALERALEALAARHEALRTSFTATPAGPEQRPLPPGARPVLRRDRLAAGEDPAARLAAEASAPFDLEGGAPFRATLLAEGPDRHLLLLSAHHLVCDGWSLGVLCRELSALYAAEARGAAAELPPVPLQFPSHAARERRAADGGAGEAALEGWRAALAGAPTLLELPAEGAGTGARGGLLRTTLPAAAAERAAAEARASRATPFMALLAAFGALLGRYTGEDDLLVGVPTAGRGDPGSESAVGFFAATLPVRVRMDGAPGFRTLVARVREAVLDAQGRPPAPPARIARALGAPRARGRAPLVQVLFSLNAPAEPLALSGVHAEPVELAPGASPFDVAVSATPLPRGGYALAWEYAANRFGAERMARMARHFETLLEDALRHPERPVPRLEMMDPGERAAVLAAARPAEPAPAGDGIAERVARWAAEAPDAPAIVDGARTLGYAALHRRSGGIARALRARGAGPETPVALCAGRSTESLAALLGILRAGAPALLLDPAHPDARLASLLSDSGARLALADAAAAPRLAACGAEVVVPGEGAELAEEDAEELLPPPHPRAAAYLAYTSGSTGLPKGVVVEHGAVGAHARGMAARMGLSPGDRVLQFASPAFDVLIEEVLPTWTAGGAVVLRPELRTLAEFAPWVAGAGVTVLNLPASFWEAWTAELGRTGTALPPSLRLVVAGSEPVSPAALAAWRARAPEVRWMNAYGLTETTVTASLWEAPPGAAPDPVPVGRAAPHARVYVLDAAGEPRPDGVPGELYVGGAAVARGYRGRPAATAERFVPDPFSGEPGARLYRTGDRAVRGADGELRFLGRMDRQVKLRGFRVEPGEVEAVLLRQPGVRDARVLLREDVPGQPRLAAYLLGEGGAALSAAVSAAARAVLPAHMVPADWTVLDAWPVTAGGKVDEAALPRPASLPAPAAPPPPSTAVERTAARVWREVLGVEDAAGGGEFFAAGGDSLLAVQLAGRLCEALGVEVTAADLFAASTLSALVERVTARGSAA